MNRIPITMAEPPDISDLISVDEDQNPPREDEDMVEDLILDYACVRHMHPVISGRF